MTCQMHFYHKYYIADSQNRTLPKIQKEISRIWKLPNHFWKHCINKYMQATRLYRNFINAAGWRHSQYMCFHSRTPSPVLLYNSTHKKSKNFYFSGRINKNAYMKYSSGLSQDCVATHQKQKKKLKFIWKTAQNFLLTVLSSYFAVVKKNTKKNCIKK